MYDWPLNHNACRICCKRRLLLLINNSVSLRLLFGQEFWPSIQVSYRLFLGHSIFWKQSFRDSRGYVVKGIIRSKFVTSIPVQASNFSNLDRKKNQQGTLSQGNSNLTIDFYGRTLIKLLITHQHYTWIFNAPEAGF